MNMPDGNLETLSVGQLEELMEDLSPDDALRPLLETILEQRRKAERKSTAKKTTTAAAGTGGGTTLRTKKGRKLRAAEPGDRAMRAAVTFNGEPAKVAVWREALAEATDPATGEIAMTGRIVQLGINAYFAQRKIDAANKVATAADDDAPEAVVEEAEAVVEATDDIAPPTHGQPEEPKGQAEEAPEPEQSDEALTEWTAEAVGEQFVSIGALEGIDLSKLFMDDDDGGVWDEQ